MAFQGEHYMHENYLSPFYSPVIFTELQRVVTADDGTQAVQAVPGAAPVEHSWFGTKPDAWPEGVPPPGTGFSPTSRRRAPRSERRPR